MGIYSEWDKFCRMARESAGTAGGSLLSPASRWANVLSYLDAAKVFVEVCVLTFLGLWNFYLWWDVIDVIYRG